MIEKRYYNSATLERTLAVYERHYGMSSEDFYEAHLADAPEVKAIPRHQRSSWASFVRELRELDGGDLPGHVSRELEPA